MKNRFVVLILICIFVVQISTANEINNYLQFKIMLKGR